MKLYKVTYETEILILAEDLNEALSNAHFFVEDETPEIIDWESIETEEDLNTLCRKWKGSIPYSARPHYNLTEKRCEDFVVKMYGGNTPIVSDETMEELLKNGVKK
jgi:hypothetical protein